MKKLFLLLLLLPLHAICQTDFPGDDPILLMGKQLLVKPRDESLQKYGFEGFFKDEKLKKKFACCETFNSKYSSLVNKTFTVLSVDPMKDDIYFDDYVIKLHNAETGDLYFKYDPKYDFMFPFEVIGGLKFPEGFYCKDIEMRADKFTGDTTYTTKMSNGISFIKQKKGKNEQFFLLEDQYGATYEIGKKGLILLLANNHRIDKPNADIDVKLNSNGKGYRYTTVTDLNDDDIKLLVENAITDTRLYLKDDVINDGAKLMDLLKCLIKK